MALKMKLNFFAVATDFFLTNLLQCKKSIRLCTMSLQDFTCKILRNGNGVARKIDLLYED